MILFFDRSIGTVVPRLLLWKPLRFPLQVQYHDQHFAIDEHDDVWLPQVGQWGWTVIGHDSKYHQRPNELSAIKQYGLGCFYLWGSEAPKWEKLMCFARSYERMLAFDAQTPRPFIYRIAKNGRFQSVPIP